MRAPLLAAEALLFFSFLTTTDAQGREARRLNGFDIGNAAVPADEILRGGPPRDGIPALTDPKFVSAGEAGLLAEDRVVGLFLSGTAKAYPIRILNWHEIVNDAAGGRRVAVTYCPLCGTAMVFDATVGGVRREFGVSGLLYNSDVLLYDKQTESLWSQIKKLAISGPAAGEVLRQIPARHTTWREWLKEHPQTAVLSFDTGHARDYRRDPYAGYDANPDVFFPVSHEDKRLPRKEWVLGVSVAGEAKAYPVLKCPSQRFADRLAGRDIEIVCDPASRSAHALDSAGNEIPALLAYWFAWSAFHPDTKLFRPEGTLPSGRKR